MADWTEIVVAGFSDLQAFPRAIARSTIDNDDFSWDDRLFRKAGDQHINVLGLVENRRDHAYIRHAQPTSSHAKAGDFFCLLLIWGVRGQFLLDSLGERGLIS